MSEEEKGFVVKDRRIFTEEDKETGAGDEKTQTDPSTDEEVQSQPSTEKARETEAPEPSKTDASEEQPQFPEINFPTFVVSLNASALLHLGAIEDPTTGQKTKNLPMAKQTIDILSMLEEKTAGNLNNEEKNLLKNILYDLRLMYVKEKG
jgi:predicted secreted protein